MTTDDEDAWKAVDAIDRALKERDLALAHVAHMRIGLIKIAEVANESSASMLTVLGIARSALEEW